MVRVFRVFIWMIMDIVGYDFTCSSVFVLEWYYSESWTEFVSNWESVFNTSLQHVSTLDFRHIIENVFTLSQA